ncbi:hypothetical protein [Streptomyces sp. NPDC020965]|uniref:hypothetical protein n=1 Tax=Streptomyces sp. NPDC020965 TaxID=3365105 RepID=UPI00378EF40E
MNAMHQYMLDTYRATRRGDRLPPQPGLNDWQVLRELGEGFASTSPSAAARPARSRAGRAAAEGAGAGGLRGVWRRLRRRDRTRRRG